MIIKNLSVKYKDLAVFDNFNLEIEEGKITCILGESGSGKTTLLNAIAGLIDYSGEIERGEEEFSYAFSQPTLFPNLTVRKNLYLVSKDQEKINAILKTFMLEGKEDSFPLHLSSGQRQRVSLARALLFDKKLTLLDEPLSNLDIGIKFYLVDEIKKIQKQVKSTFIIVTHDVKEAVALADRIVVIKGGKIIYENKNIEKETEKEIFDLFINSINN